MAKVTTITLVDDIDGTEAEGVVEFTVLGKDYEIDLSTANQSAFFAAIKPFIEAARRASNKGRSSAAAPVKVDKQQNQKIREWAKARGLKLADRGRIPAEVVDLYDNHPHNATMIEKLRDGRLHGQVPEVPTSPAIAPPVYTSTKPAPRARSKGELVEVARKGDDAGKKLTENITATVNEAVKPKAKVAALAVTPVQPKGTPTNDNLKPASSYSDGEKAGMLAWCREIGMNTTRIPRRGKNRDELFHLWRAGDDHAALALVGAKA